MDTRSVTAVARAEAPAASAAPRVTEMHRHARRGLAVAGSFAVAAVAALLLPRETGTWSPLHLFLVGSVTTAIATVTLMLAVTWSASPAPPRRLVALQRWTLAVGAVGVVAGRSWRLEVLMVVGGGLVASSLTIVAVLLLGVRRAARTPRFAPAIDAYVLALASALGGISLGVGLGAGALPAEVRDAHVIVNLFAFVGVVIAATLPYFTATQARTKMSRRASPARLRAASFAMWTSAVIAASAAAVGRDRTVALALAGHAVVVAGSTTLLPGLHRKQLVWAGPRLLQLLAGIAWWAAMAMWLAASYERVGLDRAPLLALVIGGYGQILAASFAYLVPVVRGGGHEELGAGLRRTRSWAGFALGNLAALCAAVDEERLLTIALLAWIADAVARTVVARTRSGGASAG